MPGIHGRTVSGGLVLIGSVAKDVVELPFDDEIANVEFADCIPHTIPAIGGSISVAGIR